MKPPQTVDSVTINYLLDLNAGLTQVLDDGANSCLYGNGRIGELQPGSFAYHLGVRPGASAVVALDDTAREWIQKADALMADLNP